MVIFLGVKLPSKQGNVLCVIRGKYDRIRCNATQEEKQRTVVKQHK